MVQNDGDGEASLPLALGDAPSGRALVVSTSHAPAQPRIGVVAADGATDAYV